MKALLRISIRAWTIWWCLMQVSSYPTLTLDLDDPTTENYLALVVALRAALRGNQVTCGLPVLGETARAEDRFVLVELEITSTIKVTLAIDVLNVYVVGYLDKHGTSYRANLLKGIPEIAMTDLFEEANIRRHIPFSGDYPQLEKQGVDRDTLPLGLFRLKAAAKSVYGVEKPKPKDEAGFLIIAVQMISEAARFKYIAKQIRAIQPYESVLPNPKVSRLENKWGPLSEAIIGSDHCGELMKPVELFDEYNIKWIVRRVDEISADMGILKHSSPRVQVS
ncbi:ribosome-inactivating protein PD-L3/PD-L4-like [Silene latifolia]|uniref:ribosome-inactivating protein PD-L3/PD-L4-like n=1 Tax=Silene latifolia TaxID=37657 RepID=UPI003D776E0F